MNRKPLYYIILLVALLAGCSQPAGLVDSTPNPGAPDAALTPHRTPEWRQNEHALAERILPFAVDPICEWQPVANEGGTLYAWVFCQDRAGGGSGVSIPARITIDGAGAFTRVEVPGSDYCRDTKTLFPPAVRPLLDAFDNGAVRPLMEHLAGRTSLDDPPLAAESGTADLAVPSPTPTPTPEPAPVRRWRPHTLLLAFAGANDRIYVSENFGPPAAIGEWDSCAGRPLELVWSPDGSTLAYPHTGDDGKTYLALYDHASGVTQFRPFGRDGHNLAWSPDGRWLAWTEGSSTAPLVRVISVQGAAEQVIQPADRFWWLAGVSGLVYQTRAPDGEFMTTDLRGVRLKRLSIPRLEDPHSRVVGFVRQAGVLLIWRENERSGTAELWRAGIDGVREARLLTLPGKVSLEHVAVSADGRFVAVQARDETAGPQAQMLYKQMRLTSGVSEDVPASRAAAWTPNGDYLLGTIVDSQGETQLVVDRLLTGERVYTYPLPVVDGAPSFGLGWVKK